VRYETPMPCTSTGSNSGGVKVVPVGVGLIDRPVIAASGFLTRELVTADKATPRPHLLCFDCLRQMVLVWFMLHHITFPIRQPNVVLGTLHLHVFSREVSIDDNATAITPPWGICG
jgi:hypothetical protein